MLRYWLVAFFLAASPMAAMSVADRDDDLISRCSGPFQLCGYVEKGSGSERIPARFEVARPFQEDLAAVRIDGLFGYIDPTGRIVIAPRFQAAGAFTGGYAEVRLENASGIVDRSGRLVVPAQFQRIIPFNDGTFIAEPLRQTAPSGDGWEVRLDGFHDPSPFTGRRGGLYHLRRGWLTDRDLEFSLFDSPERGLVWAGKRNADNEEEWGLLRSDGTWRVTPRYNHVQRLMETHAVVASMPDRSLPPLHRREAMRRGAVDRNGELVVPLQFVHLSYWRGGYGSARDGRPVSPGGSPNAPRQGIVRADGSLLANRWFDEIDIREDGSLPRGRVGDRWYSIERDGRLVRDRLDGTPLVECPGGLRLIQRGGRVEFRRPGDDRPVGLFDKGYFSARDCSAPAFAARRRDRWYIILRDGSVLGGNRGFQNTYSFDGSHAAVQLDGRWGIIDRSGAFTVVPQFPALRPDRNGTFAVGDGENAYWINAAGDRVERPAVERPPPAQALTCPGGLRFFQRAGLWGFQDASGRTVIEPRYRALSCFTQGISWTAAPGGNAWCPVGPDGQRRAALPCRGTFYPEYISHHRPEKFDDDPFESNVLWNRAWLDYQAGNRAEPPRWISDRFGHRS